MIPLALRLAVAGGREALARLIVTAVGVALATGLLLIAAAFFPALHAQEGRLAWTLTSASNLRPGQNPATTDPLLWRLSTDHFEGKAITRVDVAALGMRAPVPPGLRRLPGPGQLAVSPAMRWLLRQTPPDLLGDRFGGRITQAVGRAALAGPGDLVVFVGHAAAQLRGQPLVTTVHSIESAPLTLPLTGQARAVLAIGVLILMAPLVVLIGTAARLSAARREQRLAAMRLVGSTPRQTRLIAGVEAAIAAIAGTVLGFGVYQLIRPYAARVSVDGWRFFPTDLRLVPAMAILIAVAVPALGIGASLISLRRVRISPLGVVRAAAPSRPTWRRLLVLGVGLAAFGAGLPDLSNARSSVAEAGIAASLAVIVVGIVIAGPLLTMGIGRLLVAAARRPAALLAGRRLAGRPSAAFRAISGLILAVFAVTMISEFSVVAQAATIAGQSSLPPGSVISLILGPQTPPMSPTAAAPMLARLSRVAGVRRVIDLRVASGLSGGGGSEAKGAKGKGGQGGQGGQGSKGVPFGSAALVARCADLLAARIARCADPGTQVSMPAQFLEKGLSFSISGAVLARPVTGLVLGRLPLAVVVVTTSGHRPTLERVRTILDVSAGTGAGALPMTTADVTAASRRVASELNRLGIAALVATLIIAGLSLAVAVGGGLVERRRPFALLRLAGVPRRELHRVVLAETAIPLLMIAVTSAGLGLAVAADVIWVLHKHWQPPSPAYWPALAGGLVLAIAVAVGATTPLLSRLTSPETARFE